MTDHYLEKTRKTKQTIPGVLDSPIFWNYSSWELFMSLKIRSQRQNTLDPQYNLLGEQRDSNDDSDESEDEDFVAGETPDTSPSSSSESEEGEGGDKKKKKKKKVFKETEIGKQRERKVCFFTS